MSKPVARLIVGALSCACLAGCVAPARTASSFTPPAELKWFRTAAERELAYEQAYRHATEIIDRAASQTTSPWAVVLDADETILDNGEYQDRIARAGAPFQMSTWNAWVKEKKAVAFASARRFISFVRARGGKVAIVTSRVEAVCQDTRENLRAQDVEADALLCAPEGVGDKQPRFDRVASGLAFGEPHEVAVLLFVGDNVRDCPHQTQAHYDPALFGTRCIVLPNPMYGSWGANAYP